MSPSAEQALSFVEEFHSGVADKTMLVLIGDCLIDYQGRARSLLEWGERVVMVKQDGTVLVHKPVMREPVNWMPADSVSRFFVRDTLFVLDCYCKRPPEKMGISFRSLQMVYTCSLRDRAEIVVSGMEADVVNQIVENPGSVEEGLRITKREKQVKSGMIDLFGYDTNHTPVIIEVKRSIANISAVHQLRMYVLDVKGDVNDASVRGILCAPRVPDMVKKLCDSYDLEWREVERKVILPDNFQKKLLEF